MLFHLEEGVALCIVENSQTPIVWRLRRWTQLAATASHDARRKPSSKSRVSRGLMDVAQQTFYQFAGADSTRQLTKFLDALRWLEQTFFFLGELARR